MRKKYKGGATSKTKEDFDIGVSSPKFRDVDSIGSTVMRALFARQCVEFHYPDVDGRCWIQNCYIGKHPELRKKIENGCDLYRRHPDVVKLLKKEGKNA